MEVPATIGAMDPFDAAKKIRILARHLATPPTTPSLVLLREAIEKRTSKAERLRLLDNCEDELNKLYARTVDCANQIKIFAQHLPTEQNLPNGKAENTLRAIQAVLKNYEKGSLHEQG